MPELSELVTRNHFPSCVVVQLHFEQKGSAEGFGFSTTASEAPAQHPEVQLSLSIQFSDQQELELPPSKLDAVLRRLGAPGGKLRFGIKRGTLRLSLKNCRLPLGKVKLFDRFEASVGVEMQTEAGREVELSGSAGRSSDLSGKATIKAGLKVADKTTQKYASMSWQIHKTGGEDDPGWQFSLANSDTLKGLMQEALLGTLVGQDLPYEMKAQFVVRLEDVELCSGQFLYTKDVTRNKRAVIEKAIVKNVLYTELSKYPCLSEVQWRCPHG